MNDLEDSIADLRECLAESKYGRCNVDSRDLEEVLNAICEPKPDDARDAARLRAIWDGAIGDSDHPIKAYMQAQPEPKDYAEFVAQLDAAMLAAQSASAGEKP